MFNIHGDCGSKASGVITIIGYNRYGKYMTNIIASVDRCREAYIVNCTRDGPERAVVITINMVKYIAFLKYINSIWLDLNLI